jgi:hypothetical protein
VTVVKTEATEEDLEVAFQGQEVIISAVGATGFDQQKKFVDAALRAGVKRFIPSEFSANSQDEVVLQLLPLFAQKKELIEYLRSKETEGLTWTGIATSGLFDWVSDFFNCDLRSQLGVSNECCSDRASKTASWSSTLPIVQRQFGTTATKALP